MLKFIKRTNAYMNNIQSQFFLKDFSKYVKDYSQNQKLLNSYDLNILDQLNYEDQELQNLLQKNQEWFYKEILRDQHIGIEIINRYFKQRKRLGLESSLIVQTLQNLQIAQSLLKENDPGYPDILGKNFFISNLYDSFVKELNSFFNPRFQISSQDFSNSIKLLEGFKFKDHQTIMHILNKIQLNFGISTDKKFELTITRDLLQIPLINENILDQDNFKKYLIKILSIRQPTFQQLKNQENEKDKLIDQSQGLGLQQQIQDDQNLQQNSNSQFENFIEQDLDIIDQHDFINTEDFIQQEDQQQSIQQNKKNQDQNNELSSDEIIQQLDSLFERTSDFFNNVKVLQYKFFSSIKSLRENYFMLTSKQKKKFIEQDPYLLLSLKQFEYMLMKIGIISPRDLLLDESDSQADLQFEQIITDQIQNLNLNPSLLNITFQDFQQQIEYDIDSLIESGKQYQFDQNIDSLLNFANLLQGIDSINEYSYEEIKDKYMDYKDNYQYTHEKYNYYYTNTFKQCQEGVIQILNTLQDKQLSFVQNLKIYLIKQSMLLEQDNKQNILKSVEQIKELTSEELEMILKYVHNIDQDIVDKLIEKFQNQIIQKLNQYLIQLDQDKISNIGCILTTLIKKQLIESNKINLILRQLFSQDQLEYLSLNQQYNTQFQIQQIIFLLKYHIENDQKYYSNSHIKTLMQQTLSRLSISNKNFKYHTDPILESMRRSFEVFNEEQNFLNQLQNDNFNIHPIILSNQNDQMVFLDMITENYNKNNALIQSRNFLIQNLQQNEKKQKICISKVFKLSDFTQDLNYYQTFNFELKQNLQDIIQNIYNQQNQNKSSIINELEKLKEQLKQNQDNNKQFILTQILHKLQQDLQKYENNEIIQNRIKNQLSFILDLLEKQLNIDIQQLRQIISIDQEQQAKYFSFDFIGQRSIQNYFLNQQFDNYETKILNFQIFSNPDYFLIQDWEIELKDKLGMNQFYQTDKFIFQNFGLVKKLLIPFLSGREQRKITNINIFWEYYVNQDINLDLKQKLYTIEQFFEKQQNLTQQELWKLCLLNFSYELRSQQNIIQKIQQFFQLKIFNKIFQQQDSQNKVQSIFPSKFLDEIIQEKIKIESPYQKLLTPYILYKKQIDYYQDLVQNILPQKIIEEQNQENKNQLNKELHEAKLYYYKLMEDFKKDFTLNYNQLENKLLMKDYINIINYQDDDSKQQQQSEELYNQQQSELILVNNLLKNILLYKNQQQFNLDQNEQQIFQQYQNQIKDKYLSDQILLLEKLPNQKIKDIFTEEDYEIFENLFPYTEIRNFSEQNIKDLLIMISIHLNQEQINNYEANTFVQHFMQQNNMQLKDQQIKDILLLFNDEPQTKYSFNTLYNENITYKNTYQIDDFEKKIYLEMFSLDRGGSQIDKKWLQQDKKELSDFIDEVNKNSSDPRKDLQNYLARKKYDIDSRSPLNIPEFVKSDKELSNILGTIDIQKRFETLSQNIFNKNYQQLTTKDLQIFTENLISNLGLLKKRPASNLDEIILLLISHENMSLATRNNLLIALEIFEFDINKFYVGEHLYELPPYYLHKNYIN